MSLNEIALGIMLAKAMMEDDKEKTKKPERPRPIPIIKDRGPFSASHLTLISEHGEGVLKEASVVVDSKDFMVLIEIDGRVVNRRFDEFMDMSTATDYFMASETAEGYYALQFRDIEFHDRIKIEITGSTKMNFIGVHVYYIVNRKRF